MADITPSIDFPLWLQTPPGRYLLAWEQAQIDIQVADVFGFHAVQLGLPELDALQANRMPHRWLVQTVPSNGTHGAMAHPSADVTGEPVPASAGTRAVMLACDSDALPFATHSLDLIVLPHTLEFARDPHHTLREVERVLVPEGRVIVVGFNPRSLWGVRQWGGRWARRVGAVRDGSELFLPRAGEFIAPRRLRDWLRLLSFEVDRGSFGCYRPPLHSDNWLQRCAWMDRAGDRWWPVLGAVYMVSAVKRVRGMRLVGMARKKVQKSRAAQVAVSQNRDGHREPGA